MLLVCPFLDGVKHDAVDLDRLVAEAGVVEDADDIVHDFINRNSWVLPRIEYSSTTC